ncbi:hypothetical protein KC726_02635 [Candidatus Woesebacteria bacterium]|nr:hypothetical protein [Candidatus Woesebacteria bacterium]
MNIKALVVMMLVAVAVVAIVLWSKNNTYTPPSPIVVSPTQVNSGQKQTYVCPGKEWVDCMPGPGKGARPECEPEYLDWATENCPGFNGAAY